MADAQPVDILPTGEARTLAIDVGGTGLKAAIVDDAGRLLVERVRIETPVGAPPEKIVDVLAGLVAPLGAYDRISVGFPGVVRDGRVLTAPNLGNTGWQGFDLAGALAKALGKSVRVANDADLQGLAVIAGKGIEMVMTLGTGFGTGLYADGRLAPHLELSRHPFRNGETYDQQLGNAARKAVGGARWNKRVRKAIANLRALTTFDHLYIGGGNAKKLDFELPADVTVVSNEAGLRGGVVLWHTDHTRTAVA
jgi:polyphosphate glucokinase